MKAFIKTVAPLLLILLFVYAAISKLLAIHDFREQLYNQTFPHWMANILLYSLIPAELFTVLLLCIPRTQRLGLKAGTFLLIAFTGYILLVILHIWDRVPCSCGGVLSGLTWRTHLVFNACFLALSLAALRFSGTSKNNIQTKS